jgi:serine phosphatase RsbU (regulator of sigma subunit)
MEKEALIVYSNLGAAFNNSTTDNSGTVRFKKSIYYYEKALTIAKKLNNSSDICSILISLSNTYTSLKSFDLAISKINQAREIAERENNSQLLIRIYSNLCMIYSNQKKPVLGEPYGKKAAALALATDNVFELSNSVKFLSKSLLLQGKFSGAKNILQETLARVRALGMIYDEFFLLTNYATCCEKLGDFKSAYDACGQIKAIEDSLMNQEILKSTSELEERYQSEKKDLQIKQQESSIQLKESENKRKSIIIWLSALALLGTGFFAVIAFINFRKSKKANHIIQNQNEVLELQKQQVEHQKDLVVEKQKEIIDSINYAQRIQQAILTGDAIWSKISKDYFIFFQPKAIVSGDFYWAHILPNQCRVFAVADCTGHGVPGGFMSMLGNSFLNEIVVDNKIFKADIILNKLREKIIHALEQKGQTEQKDGMDISLCVWNKMDNTLEFAGANNSIWIVRNNEITEYKPDKMPIGTYTDTQKNFNSQHIALQRGDCIYLSTDGYADQFGGPNGKKFMYKQFANLLRGIAGLSIEEQAKASKSAFETWRSNHEQLDDMCVLGIKIN